MVNRSDWVDLGETVAASVVLAIGTAAVWVWQTTAGGVITGINALEAWFDSVIRAVFGSVGDSFAAAAESASASAASAGFAGFLVAIASTAIALIVLSRIYGVVVRGS